MNGEGSRSLTLLAAGVLVAAAGCTGGSGASPAGGAEPPPAGRAAPVQRPPFIVYETSGRQVITDALGNTREVKLRRKLFASARALRTEDLGGGPTVIMRLDRKVMWFLDAPARRYIQQTFGQYAARYDADRKLLSGQLSDTKLPPERRRALEVMLGRRQPRVTVENDPDPVEILGRKCRHVSYYEDGRLRVEEWVAEDLVLPCNLTEVRSLTGDFSKELLRRLHGRRGFGMRTRVIGRLPTLPRITETRVTELELPEKLDAKLFELPEGYTKLVPRPRRD
ncbi:MAG: hypothetical protein ACYTGB_03050 [Planctomycetota bacterium]|jgi:hypothetical protein